MIKFVLLPLLLIVTVRAENFENKKLVCYVGTWAANRQGDALYDLDKIDPFLCTYVIYASAAINRNTNKIKTIDPMLDLCDNGGKCGYKKFVDLKLKNPQLKTMISIGGWKGSSALFSQMAYTSTNRSNFIKSCVSFVCQHGFDGVDLNWEYPTKRGGTPEDKKNFATLVRAMKRAFEKKNLTLSATVSAIKETIVSAYSVSELSKYLDFINLRTFDFHGSWEPNVHHHAPVDKVSRDTEDDQHLNVKYAVKYWIFRKADPSKLILGIPSYGRSFNLTNPSSCKLGAPGSTGSAGPYGKQDGYLGYNEICLLANDPSTNWQVTRDRMIVSPYAVFTYKGATQWVGYDDEASAAKKGEFINTYKLGGAMLWSLEMDDFRGNCGKGEYPLTNAIKAALSGPPSPPPPPKQPCSKEGLNPDPDDCKSFYFCILKMKGSWRKYRLQCIEDQVYNPNRFTCDQVENVPSCS